MLILCISCIYFIDSSVDFFEVLHRQSAKSLQMNVMLEMKSIYCSPHGGIISHSMKEGKLDGSTVNEKIIQDVGRCKNIKQICFCALHQLDDIILLLL